jgi:hypothetical protein
VLYNSNNSGYTPSISNCCHKSTQQLSPDFHGGGTNCVNYTCYLRVLCGANHINFYKFPHRSVSYSVLIYVHGRHALAQLVEALRYKPEDRGFFSRLCHYSFSLT